MPRTAMEDLEQRYGVKAVVRKTRVLFWIENIRVHLDCVEGLGDFVEIEVTMRSICEQRVAARKARSLMQLLGIADADTLGCSYEDLLEKAALGRECEV